MSEYDKHRTDNVEERYRLYNERYAARISKCNEKNTTYERIRTIDERTVNIKYGNIRKKDVAHMIACIGCSRLACIKIDDEAYEKKYESVRYRAEKYSVFKGIDKIFDHHMS
jgi:hypothetical protein